jgi:iron complex outermembrane receptor protein
MKLYITFLLLFFPLLLPASATPTNESASASTRPYQLETVVVQAPRIPSLSTPLTQEEMLDNNLNLNAGQVVEEIPGVSSARTSIDTPEPVVRGLGWERVAVQMDYLPIYGSCPARMDPPTVYLSPEAIENLIVVKGLPPSPSARAARADVSWPARSPTPPNRPSTAHRPMPPPHGTADATA